MAHLITFTSSQFDVSAETPNPIGPIAGEGVLKWLREKLVGLRYEVTALDDMRLIFALLVLVVAGCSGTAAKPTYEDAQPVITSQPTTVPLEHPLLTFDVVPIPRECVADKVSGDVEVLETQRGWVHSTNNVRLTHGTKLRIGSGASLTIRFSSAERVEFSPVETERWVVFDMQGGQ